MSPQAVDRLLAGFSADRRDFLRKILLGSAWATPFLASFSLDGLSLQGLEAGVSNLLCSNVTVGSNLASVGVSKTADTASANTGDTVTFLIEFANCSPDLDAFNVVVADPLPPEFLFQSVNQVSGPPPDAIATPPVGSSGSVVFTYLTFPANSVASFQIVTIVA